MEKPAKASLSLLHCVCRVETGRPWPRAEHLKLHLEHQQHQWVL